MKKAFALGLILAVTTACGTPGQQGPAATPSLTAGPTEITTGFYTAYLTLTAGGVPDAKGRAKLDPFISPALGQLLIDADAAEAAYKKATKGEVPPLVEGDLFSSTFEGANSFAKPVCNWIGKTGTCDVALTYDDKKEKPVTWTDKTDLVLTDAGWRVDDIQYGANWAFGNKGKLTDTLKSVIEEAKMPVD